MSHSPALTSSASPCPTVDDVVLPCFGVLVELELQHARKKHRKIAQLHDAMPIIGNELIELQELRFKPVDRRDPLKMLHQLVKVAAMCNRAAEDLGLVDVKGMELETLLYSRFETKP